MLRSLAVRCGASAKKKHTKTASKQSPLAKPVARGGTTLEKLPRVLVERSPSVALAYTYLGDAVWELYARQHMILKRVNAVERSTDEGRAIRPQEGVSKGWCSGKAMHAHLTRLLERKLLTDEEMAILKWGRDFGHESRAGHKGDEQRDASALEALVAYLYLFDAERLHEVLTACGMTICGKPLSGVSGVADAVVEAMDSLRVENREISA